MSLRLGRTLKFLQPKLLFLQISKLRPSKSVVFLGKREPCEFSKSYNNQFIIWYLYYIYMEEND